MEGEVIRAGKWICGSIVGFWGLLAPVQVLILCVCIAIIVDFITGNIADYKRHKRAHQKYVFKSEKMWDTCWKLGLSIIGIGMAYMLDVHVLPNLGVSTLPTSSLPSSSEQSSGAFWRTPQSFRITPYSELSGHTWRDRSARKLK